MERNLRLGSYIVEKPSVWLMMKNCNGLVYEPSGELGVWDKHKGRTGHWPRPSKNRIRLLGERREIILASDVHELIEYFGDAIIEATIRVEYSYKTRFNNMPIKRVRKCEYEDNYYFLVRESVRARLRELDKLLPRLDSAYATYLSELRKRINLYATKVALDGCEIAL